MKQTMKDALRRLQKEGEYYFPTLSRQESRSAAEELVKEAIAYDRKRGITESGSFAVFYNSFGYFAKAVN